MAIWFLFVTGRVFGGERGSFYTYVLRWTEGMRSVFIVYCLELRILLLYRMVHGDELDGDVGIDIGDTRGMEDV